MNITSATASYDNEIGMMTYELKVRFPVDETLTEDMKTSIIGSLEECERRRLESLRSSS